ncbi:MAG: hypothetical protein QW286_03090 [Candidatus Aenigmatarchaeota archaeon]
MMRMEERAKYILVGIAIGIVIGMILLFMLINFRIIRPFGLREFPRPNNLTNFTRNFTRGMV